MRCVPIASALLALAACASGPTEPTSRTSNTAAQRITLSAAEAAADSVAVDAIDRQTPKTSFGD